MKVLSVPIDRIEIVADRDHRGEGVDLKDLLESIPTIGMLHPLLVLPERNGKHELLAGHRRLRAARKLGLSEVAVEVVDVDALQAELVTIDENLVRKNLPPSEEDRQLARAKEIYEKLYPHTRHGGARTSSSGQDGHLKQPAFVDYAAKATGQSPRTIRRKVSRATSGNRKEPRNTKRAASRDAKQAVVVKVTDVTGRPRTGNTAPTPAAPESPSGENTPSPIALAEAVLKAAVQFQMSIKDSEITEPERILELAQQVRDILNDVSMFVRAKHPMKTAATA